MTSGLRVALALDLATPAAGRWFCIGAHNFAHEHLDWEIQRAGNTSILTWDQALTCEADGILGILEPWHLVTREQVRRAQVVILNNAARHHDFHTVTSDDIEAGRRAARHLLDRRIQHFAYVGTRGIHFSEQRRRGFEQVLREAGYTRTLSQSDDQTANDHPAEFARWLQRLPRPCGVMCANDGIALTTVNAALEAGLNVPEDVAVVGVSNDELACVESVVTLTSVQEDFVEVGYRAAAHLDALLRGRPVAERRELVQPGEVIERESTRVFGVADPLVHRALLLISHTEARAMTVDKLLGELGNVSRRLLELRFRKALGRSPYQEILHTRIAHARRLLRNTRLSVGEVAYETGFYDPAQFCRHFKRIAGHTPSDYRAQPGSSHAT